jgi:phosphoribulokinase
MADKGYQGAEHASVVFVQAINGEAVVEQSRSLAGHLEVSLGVVPGLLPLRWPGTDRTMGLPC